jgi:hypothetical protein
MRQIWNNQSQIYPIKNDFCELIKILMINGFIKTQREELNILVRLLNSGCIQYILNDTEIIRERILALLKQEIKYSSNGIFANETAH